MAMDMIINEARGMSESEILEVLHFMRFLKLGQKNNLIGQKAKAGMKRRIADKYKGKGWMAEDFDAPLDDFKEYM